MMSNTVPAGRAASWTINQRLSEAPVVEPVRALEGPAAEQRMMKSREECRTKVKWRYAVLWCHDPDKRARRVLGTKHKYKAVFIGLEIGANWDKGGGTKAENKWGSCRGCM